MIPPIRVATAAPFHEVERRADPLLGEYAIREGDGDAARWGLARLGGDPDYLDPMSLEDGGLLDEGTHLGGAASQLRVDVPHPHPGVGEDHGVASCQRHLWQPGRVQDPLQLGDLVGAQRSSICTGRDRKVQSDGGFDYRKHPVVTPWLGVGWVRSVKIGLLAFGRHTPHA